MTTRRPNRESQRAAFFSRKMRNKQIVNATYLFSVVAFFVVVYYGIFHYQPPIFEIEWATIEDMNAHWSYHNDSLYLSLKVVPHKRCSRYPVTKIMRELQNDVVIHENPISMVGTLSAQLKGSPPGQELSMEDYAKPEKGVVKPGHYELTVILSCESPGTDNTVESTLARKALIVVEKPTERTSMR